VNKPFTLALDTPFARFWHVSVTVLEVVLALHEEYSGA
jgi:hypothetical protein